MMSIHIWQPLGESPQGPEFLQNATGIFHQLVRLPTLGYQTKALIPKE